MNAFQTADGFMHVHALHERSHTLGVAVASADELDRCHDVVFNFYVIPNASAIVITASFRLKIPCW